MTHTVVIGSHGMVGRALMSYMDAVGTYRNNTGNPVDKRHYEYLDITNKDKVSDFFFRHRPKQVFIAAANPHVDGCENITSDKVNINGISDIISNCKMFDSQVIFFSSSYVFDGKSQTPYKPHDESDPINRYGRQKETIERILKLSEGLQWLVIRTVGVFGKESEPKNFVSQIVKAVKEGKRVFVPADQTMNPIHSKDLAKVSIHIASRYAGEIFHVAGNKCMSKYDFAISVAYKLGYAKPHDLITGMKSDDMPQIAPRPLNGCLDCKSLEARALTIPSFEKGLETYLGVQNDKR